MTKLITLNKAKEEIKRLKEYVDLVENYDTDTIDKVIIKEYAITNSIEKVIQSLKKNETTINGQGIEKTHIVSVINSRANDKLHRIIKSGYLKRTKHSRKR